MLPLTHLCTGHHPILEHTPSVGWTCVKCGRRWNPEPGRVRAPEQIAEHGFAVLAARVLGGRGESAESVSKRAHRILGVPVDPDFNH